MKIIVTGGYGFIGSNLIKSLLTNKNYQVLNLDKVTNTSIPLSLKSVKSRNYNFFLKYNWFFYPFTYR